MGPRRTPPRPPPWPCAADAPLTPYELQREATISTNKARLTALSIPTLGGAIRDDDDDDDDDHAGGSDRGGGDGGGSGGLKRKTRGGKGARQGGY
jgi:hypothetical protein